ncbi:apolipoprotein N-acyltransferase [Polynucleobacter sp. UB-Tiil-W10]|uniref:apolipoprotein N-acyltransferase n=1 Tax=Polynucleobacter sp. UB-Tiil-W10 TaxID=1855648 RepID=UPI001C0C2FB7|nr:apolipoprotein N-acyltransferase [Polynucleobacter sp. UB-Tiil-W10]MBU3540255.1 apolipoprotein N-acyltransferase [Polynucleobacter sp. UB-Tiil-W10]
MSIRIFLVFSLFILGASLAAIAELPYGGWIQIPVLSLLWWRLDHQQSTSLIKKFALGLSFGIGYFVVGLWWLYISLHDVGGMNALLACMGVLLLSAYVALYFSLATLAIPLLKTNRLSGLFLASSWVLAEFLRGYIFTGFPWMGFAETQFNGPFAPIAPFFGGLACTFLVVWTSWEIYQLRKHVLSSALLIASVIVITQFASFFTFTKPTGEPISVRLIQGNFEQTLKFNPQAIGRQIDFYAGAITKEAANLIIIPETAFPWPLPNLPIGLVEYLQNFSNNSGSNVLLGLIGEVPGESGMQYSNRATGLSPNTAPYQYDKAHLVPFGEFIPPGFQWFVKAFHVPMSDFARGRLDQSPFTIARKGQEEIHAAITICYEDVFGGELASRIQQSDKPVNLLINMTNLAWFGESQASTQQLRLSQLRSLETGLPALRATNTGITAVLGSDGKVLQALPEFTQATLSTQVQAYSGKTPYVIWGNLPILGISCLLLLWGLIRHRRF